MAQRNSLNEALKRREAEGAPEDIHAPEEDAPALSPGGLVRRRFSRNGLAVTGLGILILMFAFAFIGPLFYGYSQTRIFYKSEYRNVDYASAAERTEAVAYAVGADVGSSLKNRLNAYITAMEAGGGTVTVVADGDGARYVLEKLGDKVYALYGDALTEVAVIRDASPVATFNRISGTYDWETAATGDAAFDNAVRGAVAAGSGGFRYGGESYTVEALSKTTYRIAREAPQLLWSGEDLGDGLRALAESASDGARFAYGGADYVVLAEKDGSRAVCSVGSGAAALVASPYVFNAAEAGTAFSDAFKASALLALCGDGAFTADGKTYAVSRDADGIRIRDGSGAEIASLGTLSVRRSTGEDTLPAAFKEKAQRVIETMRETGETTASFTFPLPDGASAGGGGGAGAFTVTLKNGAYTLSRGELTQLVDIYAPPSRAHPFGTDGDGMDILARMMAGGRVSLTVGFAVVLLETLLGAVMGGLAGFFGGWVDALVMRLADIFFCIPALPVLIILGAFFDAVKMAPYLRLFGMMAALGLLGWASVARLVRGQLLSLREQDFMIAEEAAGIRASRRIFRHLVPNVTPLLIVNATMGLGSVIILESTLSFLGLGIKHPLATWGTMINSVTRSTDSMIRYAYIWVPVGLLICLTVIAFNFVGDGLRDAMDPKSKR